MLEFELCIRRWWNLLSESRTRSRERHVDSARSGGLCVHQISFPVINRQKMQGPPPSEASGSSSQSASVSSSNPYNGVRYAHWNAPAVGYHQPTPYQPATMPYHSYPQANAPQFGETLRSPDNDSEYNAQQALEEPCESLAWEKAFENFFQSLHFTRTWRGFELDFLMLNPEWEKNQVPQALQTLISTLQVSFTALCSTPLLKISEHAARSSS